MDGGREGKGMEEDFNWSMGVIAFNSWSSVHHSVQGDGQDTESSHTKRLGVAEGLKTSSTNTTRLVYKHHGAEAIFGASTMRGISRVVLSNT